MVDGRPVIGVLALQGCIERHRPHIEAAGGRYQEIRRAEDLDGADGIIIPGGESTTMLKLIERFDLDDALHQTFAVKPVWGVCAGAILLAERVTNPSQDAFALIPMEVRRNAYGRQRESVQLEIDGFPVSFIRAPVIERVDPAVEVLARRDEHAVWVRYRRAIASTFHPELTQAFPSPMHRHFLELVNGSAASPASRAYRGRVRG